MPWLPDEKNPCYNKVADDITKLLDTFCTMLMSGSGVGQGQDHVWPNRAPEAGTRYHKTLYYLYLAEQLTFSSTGLGTV